MVQFRVFDRWGQLVFEAFDFLPEEKGWDGRLNQENMIPGVYTYHVILESLGGEKFEQSGSVTLLK